MKIYKIGVIIFFLFGIITRLIQLTYNEFSLTPMIHLLISMILLCLLLIKEPFVKKILKWFFFVQYLFGVLGILSFVTLYLIRDNYDDFQKLWLHIFHATLGGLLFHNCEKYFLFENKTFS